LGLADRRSPARFRRIALGAERLRPPPAPWRRTHGWRTVQSATG
jgi:hypothetical protein